MDDINLSTEEFTLFRKLIYQLAGIALSDAKKQLVQSRLRKRVSQHGLSSFRAYYDMLMAEGDASKEMVDFVNCITTNKTDFFREAHHFTFVKDVVVPEMAAMVRHGEREPRLRVWHAGCSTGEEPYTLAMTLGEALEDRDRWDVRQLASDIDTNVLAHAEQGIYEEERLAPVAEALRRKYFLRGTGAREGCLRARQSLRDQITFRQINLLAANWPIRHDVRFDMIFCRNVVIYFDKPTQQALFSRFEEVLRPGGYLFIGHSESLLGVSMAYESLGHTIYRLPGPGCSAPEGRKGIAA